MFRKKTEAEKLIKARDKGLAALPNTRDMRPADQLSELCIYNYTGDRLLKLMPLKEAWSKGRAPNTDPVLGYALMALSKLIFNRQTNLYPENTDMPENRYVAANIADDIRDILRIARHYKVKTVELPMVNDWPSYILLDELYEGNWTFQGYENISVRPMELAYA